jgi:hypothetical protein
MDSGEVVLDSNDGSRWTACATAWQELLDLSESDRTKILAEWRAEVMNPLPAGLVSLHSSWIVEALAGEPSSILRIIREGVPKDVQTTIEPLLDEKDERAGNPPLDIKREILRLAFSPLGQLCVSPKGPLAERLCQLGLQDLEDEIMRKGAQTVGHSLVKASPMLRARAMAAAGEPWSRTIGEASSAVLTEAERREAVVSASIDFPAWVQDSRERLLCIGLGVLGRELQLEDPGSIFCVAGRLAVKTGKTLLGLSGKSLP